jgi:hypothetical protein
MQRSKSTKQQINGPKSREYRTWKKGNYIGIRVGAYMNDKNDIRQVSERTLGTWTDRDTGPDIQMVRELNKVLKTIESDEPVVQSCKEWISMIKAHWAKNNIESEFQW